MKASAIACGVFLFIVVEYFAKQVVDLDLAHAEEPASKTKGRSKRAAVDARAMIEALANGNAAPKIGDVGTPDYGPAWDAKEDRRVWDALHKAEDHVEEVWAELLKHLDNERYCVTRESPSGPYHNWTVGDICREIIARSLTGAYMDKSDKAQVAFTKEAYNRMAWPNLFLDNDKLKKWCAARSSKQLYELQVEMCKAAKRELEKPDDESSARGRLPLEARRKWSAAITEGIESLSKSKVAVRPHHILAHIP